RRRGRRSEPIVAGAGQVAQTLGGDDCVVVLAEDVLQRGQPFDERPRVVRIQVAEKLERVAKSLAANAQTVVLVGIRVGIDPARGLAERGKAAFDQLGRSLARADRPRPGASPRTRAQRATEAVDERLVAPRVESL